MWESRPLSKGGGREYHLSSLPEETRAHLLGREASLPCPDPTSRHISSSRRISLLAGDLKDPAIQAKIALRMAYEACPAYKGRKWSSAR